MGVFFGCIAVACIIRLLGKFTLRMARSGAATAHEYLHRVISGIVASTQRRPLARLWRAVSELGLRLGHVQELQRLAMNARVDMCGETRRLEGTAERLTASVSNLRAAYQAGLGVFNDANALLNQLVVQFNHSVAFLNELDHRTAVNSQLVVEVNRLAVDVDNLRATVADARRELTEAKQEVVEVQLQRAADEIRSRATIDRIVAEHDRAVAAVQATAKADIAQRVAELRAELDARLSPNWRS